LERNKYIVVLLPDTGRNYLTKIFSDSWMQNNGFWEGEEKEKTSLKDILSQKDKYPPMISVGPGNILVDAIRLMHEYNISQLPVVDADKVIGSLDEASLMKLLYDGADFSKQEIAAVMGRPLPALDEEIDAAEAYRLLLSGTTGLVVTRNGIPAGVITRTDLINYGWQGKS
jgi:cystathionine beta-synthase